jgi:shikimate kinase
MRYFLIGFMGCGKTYWAKQWGEAFGLKYFDLDEEIEKREGKTIGDIFKEKGEDYFRKVEKHTLETYLQLDNVIIASGGGTPCFFHNMKKMNQHGITIYLVSTPAELAGRLKKEKESRPLIADVADEVLENFIAERLKQREPWYLHSMYHLHTRYLTNDNFEKIKRVNAK